MIQHFLRPFGSTYIILGAGALYFACQSIRYYLRASSSRSEEQDELNRLLDKLESPNYDCERVELLNELSILLESRSGSASLGPEKIKTIAASLEDHQAMTRAKCCHALQCILRSCGSNHHEKQCVMQYTGQLLQLLSNSKTPEEQVSCLRLLVSLASHRETHVDFIQSLPFFYELLHSYHPAVGTTVMLVTRLLFKLSENRDLLETLLKLRVGPELLSLLKPSNPRDILLHCLGLLSNLSCREPPGEAPGQQDQVSLHALLYSWPTPLHNALRSLTQHSDMRVKGTAEYMLSRMPLPASPRRCHSKLHSSNGNLD